MPGEAVRSRLYSAMTRHFPHLISVMKGSVAFRRNWVIPFFSGIT
jgi:hypothetical protein